MKTITSRTRRFDEIADLARTGEHDGGPVALHAGADDDRLARRGAVLARIGLEAQVEFPDLVHLAVRRLHRIRVAAMLERGHLPLRRRLFQIGLAPHHALPGADRRLALRNRLQIGNHVLAILGLLYPGKAHARAGQEALRIREPLVEIGLGPDDIGFLHRVGIAEEVFDRAGLAVPDVRKAGARHVLAGLHRVAGHARLKNFHAARRVAGGPRFEADDESGDQGPILTGTHETVHGQVSLFDSPPTPGVPALLRLARGATRTARQSKNHRASDERDACAATGGRACPELTRNRPLPTPRRASASAPAGPALRWKGWRSGARAAAVCRSARPSPRSSRSCHRRCAAGPRRFSSGAFARGRGRAAPARTLPRSSPDRSDRARARARAGAPR